MRVSVLMISINIKNNKFISLTSTPTHLTL